MSDLDGYVTVSFTSRKVFFLDILDVAIKVPGLVHHLLHENE